MLQALVCEQSEWTEIVFSLHFFLGTDTHFSPRISKTGTDGLHFASRISKTGTHESKLYNKGRQFKRTTLEIP